MQTHQYGSGKDQEAGCSSGIGIDRHLVEGNFVVPEQGIPGANFLVSGIPYRSGGMPACLPACLPVAF